MELILKILIPIAIVVILSHWKAVKQQDQDKPARPRPVPPPDNDEPARPRRSTAELEKFLEEVKRRKRDAEEKTAAAPVLVAEEAAPPRRVPPPMPRSTTERRTSPPRTNKPMPRRSEPVIVVQPVQAGPSRAVTMPSSTPADVQAVQATQAPQQQSPAVLMVRELLKKRESLAAAFLLREILAPPLSKRRRH